MQETGLRGRTLLWVQKPQPRANIPKKGRQAAGSSAPQGFPPVFYHAEPHRDPQGLPGSSRASGMEASSATAC